MRKEKRTERLQMYVTPAMKEQLELFQAEEGNVLSMSDFLFEMAEQHIQLRSVMRISKQKIGRRVGNQ